MDWHEFIGTILLICMALGAGAQQKSKEHMVLGCLKDSISLEPVTSATVRVAKANLPDIPVKWAITDSCGRFKVMELPSGKYILTLSCVGYRSVTRTFSLGTERKTADLGVLYTREETGKLKDVDVVAQKSLVKFEIDKIIYDVESDPDAKVSNMLDLLRKVPLVTVDGEDNIDLNGSACSIYINGRPSGLMKLKPGKGLKGIPATAVKKVEVITSPGAKYDASGVGGIINIEMARGELEGYSLYAQGSASDTGGWGFALNGMLKYNKLSASGSFSYNDFNLGKMEYNSTLENLNDTERHFLVMHVDSRMRQPVSFANVEMSYEADSLNLLTFSLFSRQYSFIRESTEYDEMQREDISPLYSYGVTEKSKTNNGGMEATLNYQRTFRKPGQLFTLSYMYNHTPSGGYTRRDMFDFREESGQTFFSPYDIRDKNRAYTDEHTVQVDYVHPFDSLQTMECGVKYIRRNTSSKGIYKRRDDPEEEWADQTERVERFMHVQNIYAAYVIYALKYHKFGLKTGVRCERALLDVSLHSDTEPDFDTHFSDVVPSVTLSLQAAPTRVWKLEYNTRVLRPGVQYLNPYRAENNANIVSYGNSHLKSERFHHVNIGFSSFAGVWSVNTNVGYRYSGNSIQAYTFMDSGRKVNTYGNIGKENSVTLNLYVDCKPGRATSFRVNANAGYIDLDSREILATAYGWQYSVIGRLQQTLWQGIRGAAYGGYFGPRIRLQNDDDGYYSYTLTLNKSFLKDRLSVSFMANNFANGRRRWKGAIVATDYIHRYEDIVQYQSFQFNLSYRFGNLRAAVKKVKRGIVNDDVKREESQQK